MKKFVVSALAVTFALGVASFDANANWFMKDKNENNNANARVQSQTRVVQPVGYDASTRDAEAQKWIYNGSSAYRGGLTGQVAVRDSMNDGDDAAFVVRPVRGSYSQFGASLRNGDTGQSDETRVNQTFNN